MAQRIDPTTGNPIRPAIAALRVLEHRPHRTALTYLFDHPAATRRDIAGGTGLSLPSASTALADLVTLGYVTVERVIGEHGIPDHFTAVDRADFASDLTALRDEFLPPEQRGRDGRVVSTHESRR